MARQLRIAKEYRLPIFLVALALGIVVNFILLIPALNQLSDQASAGRDARDRSCKLLPASSKVYADAWERGVITESELELFTSSAQQVCGPSSTP